MALNRTKILLAHLKLFTIIGFCTFTVHNTVSVKTTKNVERCLIIWSWILLVCLNIIAFVAIFSPDEFIYRGDSFGQFNDILKICFADIAVTCCYLETIIKRKPLKQFWKLYYSLQTNFPAESKNFTNFRELWRNGRFLVIFYFVAAFEFFVLFVFVTKQSKSRHLVMFWSMFAPLSYVVYLRNMQVIFYIELIRMELVKVQQDLNLMVDYSRSAAKGFVYEGCEKILRQKLADKQRNYQMIYDMFEHFQNSFGLSIIAVLSMIYVRVLVDSYFAYYTFYNKWNRLDILLLLPSLLEIPAFLITSKNCMEVIKLITFNLHSIISQFSDEKYLVSSQVQNFSLQILHQRICINGIGISRMDGYMLTRAIGSITTYMIFFIQFMPKFTNFHDNKKLE